MIISIDGPDGCGKSTAIKALHNALKGKTKHPLHCVTHPGATKLGAELRLLIKSKQYSPAPMVERLLFTADRLQFEHEFKAINLDGDIILTDRYNMITDFIYAMALNPSLYYYLDRLQNVLLTEHEFLKADYYFVMQIPFPETLSRKLKQPKDECRIEGRGYEFLERVCRSYNTITSDPTLSRITVHRAKSVITLDAVKTPEAILQDILSHLPLEEL